VDAKDPDAKPVVFNVNLPAESIRLISGAARPATLRGSADTDHRQLGVQLRGLRWQQGTAEITVSMQLPAFMDGFYSVEFDDAETPPEPYRWTNGDAAIPLAVFPRWHGAVQLALRLFTWEGSVVRAPLSAEAAIMGAFESLGQNCDLALAQRHFGVELPLTLYRWAGTKYDRLLAGLETRFRNLGDQETTTMVWERDYRLCTPYLDLHTFDYQRPNAAELGEMLDLGSATLRLLRRKLLRDIEQARRIFVFSTLDPSFGFDEMHRLHAALRGIGPAALLCVTQGVPSGRRTGVRRLADGLYAGCLDWFVIPDQSSDRSLDGWLTLCAETLELHNNARKA
jgi:hypothetical protein